MRNRPREETTGKNGTCPGNKWDINGYRWDINGTFWESRKNVGNPAMLTNAPRQGGGPIYGSPIAGWLLIKMEDLIKNNLKWMI